MIADEGGVEEMNLIPLFTGNASSAKIRVKKATKPGSGSTPSAGNNMVTYKRKDVASIKVEDDQTCYMGNWILDSHEAEPDTEENVAPQRERILSVSHYSWLVKLAGKHVKIIRLGMCPFVRRYRSIRVELLREHSSLRK